MKDFSNCLRYFCLTASLASSRALFSRVVAMFGSSSSTLSLCSRALRISSGVLFLGGAVVVVAVAVSVVFVVVVVVVAFLVALCCLRSSLMACAAARSFFLLRGAERAVEEEVVEVVVEVSEGGAAEEGVVGESCVVDASVFGVAVAVVVSSWVGIGVVAGGVWNALRICNAPVAAARLDFTCSQ